MCFCDVSISGMGGVLCVYRDDDWKPVSFYSRQLQPRETRYSTEIEALALVSTVEHFAYYLRGIEFIAYTDHEALVHLFDSTKLNNWLWRWKIKLLDYNFRVIYLEGHFNVIADTLSRQNVSTSVTVPDCSPSAPDCSAVPGASSFCQGGDVVLHTS